MTIDNQLEREILTELLWTLTAILPWAFAQDLKGECMICKKPINGCGYFIIDNKKAETKMLCLECYEKKEKKLEEIRKKSKYTRP